MLTSSLRRAGLALAVILACAGCVPVGGTESDPAGESPRSAAPEASDELLLASPSLPDSLHPLSGYGGNGMGQVNESLYTVEPSQEGLPRMVPLLADGEPQVSEDARTWTVPLRSGVRFTDGTAFNAADVVSTYRALADPGTGSPLLGDAENIESVDAVDDHTVRFRLHEPQAGFRATLLTGIAPSELVIPGEPLPQSALNRSPVGTGPYRVAEFSPGRLVLDANPDYRDGAPEVRSVTSVEVPDDASRAQSMAAGAFDGTVLPPRGAQSFSDRPGFTVHTAVTADWRGLSLPPENPFTADPEVRRALNLAVDREAFVEGILAGSGRPAHTFVPPEYGSLHAPGAVFPQDTDAAVEALDAAGWQQGPDGIRRRGEQTAALTIMYPPDDTVRRDFAVAAAEQIRGLGVETEVAAVGFEEAGPRLATDAMLLGGGEAPFDPDAQLFRMLHSRYPEQGSEFDNPSRYADHTMDELLEEGRRTLDPEQRAEAYRAAQEQYIDEPSMVLLAFVDHVYIQREEVEAAWQTSPLLLEPHDHGTGWGPWADVQDWTRRS